MSLTPSLGPIGSFIGRLFPSTLGLAGYLSLWDGATKGSFHIPVVDLVGVEVRALEIDRLGHGCYFGCGLRGADLGSSKRGSRADVTTIPGFWIDLDLRGPAHSATNLPDLGQAADLLAKFPFEPTDVVNSGHGVHLWWLFDKPWVFSSKDTYNVQVRVKAFQNAFSKIFKDAGFRVDDVSDLARVLRPPGTHNFKIPEDIKTVESVVCADHRFNCDDLDLRPKIQIAVPPEPLPITEPYKVNSQTGLPPCEHVKYVLSISHGKMHNKTLYSAVIKGKSFAGEGERDINLQKVASAIGFIDCETPPEVLAEILRPSLKEMAREATNPKNPPPTFEQAVDKIARAQQAKRAQLADEQNFTAIRVTQARFKKLQASSPPPPVLRGSDSDVSAATSGEGSGSSTVGGSFLSLLEEKAKANGVSEGGLIEAVPAGAVSFYTEKELEEFAKLHKTSVPELMQRLIIQQRDRFFVLVDGEYKSSISRQELSSSLPRDLSPFGDLVTLTTYKASGESRIKTPEEMLKGICTVARKFYYDLTIERSFYDPGEEEFHEAVCRVRPGLLPIFNPQVDQWLKLLGGEHHDKLFDWLATVTNLKEQTCALVITGVAASGKTMLAHAVSGIWTIGGPSELEKIMNNFNADLLRCPLIFADEYIPQTIRTPALLRGLIGSDFRTIAKKFADNCPLIGGLRMMICSNDDDILTFDEDNSRNEQEATAGRFLHIEAGIDAKNYLEDLGGRKGTRDWIKKDIITQHLLWLRENRIVEPAGRFLVEGFISKMHRKIALSNRNTSLVCEWIVRHLLGSGSLSSSMNKYVLIGNGKILINSNALTANWDMYMKHEKFVPSLRKLSKALANISLREENHVFTAAGGVEEKLRYYSIDPEFIFAWFEENPIGDIEAIKAKIYRQGFANELAIN